MPRTRAPRPTGALFRPAVPAVVSNTRAAPGRAPEAKRARGAAIACRGAGRIHRSAAPRLAGNRFPNAAHPPSGRRTPTLQGAPGRPYRAISSTHGSIEGAIRSTGRSDLPRHIRAAGRPGLPLLRRRHPLQQGRYVFLLNGSYAAAAAKDTSVAGSSAPDSANTSAGRLGFTKMRKQPGRSAMEGARRERAGFAQWVCVDGAALLCDADRARKRRVPAAAASGPAPEQEQDRGAPRRPEPLRAEPDRPARRRRAARAEAVARARGDGASPERLPAFLAAFEELRAALGPGVAKAARSSIEARVCAPCRTPVSDRPGRHTTSQEVTEAVPGARSMTRTASPGSPSTR